jgi:hypothetical protein
MKKFNVFNEKHTGLPSVVELFDVMARKPDLWADVAIQTIPETAVC